MDHVTAEMMALEHQRAIRAAIAALRGQPTAHVGQSRRVLVRWLNRDEAGQATKPVPPPQR